METGMIQPLSQYEFSVFPAAMCRGRPAREQVVLAWMWYHQIISGQPAPSIAQLVRDSGTSRNSVLAAIDSLIESGCLTRKTENNSKESPDKQLKNNSKQSLNITKNHKESRNREHSAETIPQELSEKRKVSEIPAKCDRGDGCNQVLVNTITNRGSFKGDTKLSKGGSRGEGKGDAKRETWFTVYDNIWHSATKGHLIAARSVGPLRKLEKEHGRDNVVKAFRSFCTASDPRFMSLYVFVQKIGLWLSEGPSRSDYDKVEDDHEWRR